ncbi:MAG: hypothetical protein KatS3mg110_1556 [Pirellulaceae bacterium]|nr:MAG: hypothetical protein KatS3mg110_1556 [Pirellulaceae bacterium]
MFWSFLLPLCLAGQATAAGTQPQVPIYFELIMDRGFPVGEERVWLEQLAKIPGVSIRIRAAELGEQPKIEREGRGWRVLGRLTAANRLVLPGAQFALGDQAALAGYVTRLRNDGPDAVTLPPGPFGLTEQNFKELFEKLQPPVGQSTANMPVDEFVRMVARRSGLAIEPAPDVLAQWATSRVQDELSELSLGTALAAAVRPWGWVVTVDRSGGMTRLRVVPPDQARGYWPIGYQPEGTVRRTLPALFTFLTVEITDTPLSDVLEAVRGRLRVPILVDHNGLAREGIRLEEVQVTLPSTRTYYKRILDQALSKARLRVELRVDEGGRPFLWVVPIRQSP